ncbi:MAG: leucine-rich repeat domain-containing protein [Bacilli bacterium]|nr:leucine-rich repeat domain-containing protein [Bacilli bacterium]
MPQDAFYNCTDLTNITIPNTVTIIGTNAFNGCVRFTSFTIPNSVTSLGSNILNQCVSLQSITISFVGKSRTSIMHC